MSLKTGRRRHIYQWKELPIADAVMDCVEEMATSEEASEIIYGYPKFEWSPGKPITNGYKNKDDDKSEYEHSKGDQE